MTPQSRADHGHLVPIIPRGRLQPDPSVLRKRKVKHHENHATGHSPPRIFQSETRPTALGSIGAPADSSDRRAGYEAKGVCAVVASTGSWLLVTAAFNEAARLPGLVESLRQLDPNPIAMWVVVDDGGTDHLAAAVAALSPMPFPVLCHRRANSGGLAAASELAAFREGAEVGLRHGGDIDWVMKLDADLRPRADYFAAHGDLEGEIGIVGGVLTGGGEAAQSHHVRGGLRAYSRPAWTLHLTLPCSLGWDVLDQVAVRQAGYLVTVVPRATAETTRTTGSSEGLIAGRRRLGLVCRMTGYSMPYVFLKLCRTFGQRPVIIGGLAFLRGYFSDVESPFPRDLLAAHRAEQRSRLAGLLRRPLSANRRLYSPR